MAQTAKWIKMTVAGVGMCVGGPALVYYVSPSEEELFLRYNPELQRRSLAHRKERQEDFDQFVTRLKQYSKSEKPIWAAWEEDVANRKDAAVSAAVQAQRAQQDAEQARKAEIKAASQK